jgi:hypothetical protein
MEKAQAVYTSPDFIEAQKTGERYAKLRIFAVEGETPKSACAAKRTSGAKPPSEAFFGLPDEMKND